MESTLFDFLLPSPVSQPGFTLHSANVFSCQKSTLLTVKGPSWGACLQEV